MYFVYNPLFVFKQSQQLLAVRSNWKSTRTLSHSIFQCLIISCMLTRLSSAPNITPSKERVCYYYCSRIFSCKRDRDFEARAETATHRSSPTLQRCYSGGWWRLWVTAHHCLGYDDVIIYVYSLKYIIALIL